MPPFFPFVPSPAERSGAVRSLRTMGTPRLIRSLFSTAWSRRQRAAFVRFHTGTVTQAVRWGLVLAVALWAMAWCLGAVLRPVSALEFGSVLAVLLAGYGALACVVARPLVARYLQFLLACCNIASGFMVMFGVHYVSDDPEVALIGMIMVTFYAVVAFRIRPHYVLPAMLVYDTVYLARLHAAPGVTPDLFCLHAYLLGIAVVGGFIAAVVLEANMRTLFLQRQAIERQQQELKAEHARSEELLHNMLPPAIAARLKQDPGVIAERYEQASILFADLVGFTAFSDGRRPEEVVELLNTLFSRFDALIAARGLEKIKTIGDAYMVVAGLPRRRHDHAEALASLALAMHEAADAITVAGGYRPELRIGIHSGPVVAGVIGTRRLAYDVWGDAVNTASRMETLASPGTILLSAATAARLEHRFEVQERGLVSVKGKGLMNTYVLWGERTAPEGHLWPAAPRRHAHLHERPGMRKARTVERPDLLRACGLAVTC